MARSRSSTVALTRLLHDSPMPVYILDPRRKILFGNQACSEWLRLEFEEIVGRQVEYHHRESADETAALANSLCPPPEAFQGDSLAGTICCTRPDGGLTRREAEFRPLSDGSRCAAVLVLVSADETELGDSESALTATPADLHARLGAIRNALAKSYACDHLVGESPAIVRARHQVQISASAQCNVLISGPSGSGREHTARTIHYASEQAGLLTTLACPLQSPESIQQSLTSLLRDQAEQTQHGLPTVLLLDVDETPRPAQHELLGFLQLPSCPLRVLSTSQTAAGRLQNESTLLPELGYRLTTVPMDLPPLTARVEDIPLLCQHFVEEVNAEGGKQWSGFTPESLEELASYSWPGNVDELREIVRQSCTTASGIQIQLTDLPEKIQFARQADARPAPADTSIDLDEFLAKIEKELLERALGKSKGNKTKAAEMLGMTRARFHRRLTQLDIDPPT